MLSFYLTGFKKLLGIGKKIFLVIAVYFIVVSLFLYFMNKDKPRITYDPIKENRKEIYKVINDPNLNKTKQGQLTINVFRTMTCGFIGEACTNNPYDGDKNFEKSIFGFASNLVTLPYTHPPASGIVWAYSGLQNAGFVPKSYAAEGIGLAAIKPFMNLWKVFRDISYLLLVLILITIGFMIMFRMKLNPQTVISVENALPGIVFSLILITFSFAIAGFLIDLMYVLIIVGISLLSKADSSLVAVQLQNQYLNAKMGTLWDSFLVDTDLASKIPLIGGLSTLFTVGDALTGVLPHWINNLVKTITGLLLGNALLTFVLQRLKVESLGNILDKVDIIGNSFGDAPGAILKPLLAFVIWAIVLPLTFIHGAGWIVGILIGFTLLFLLFRIFFLLFTSYLKILVLIIFSPLFLLFQAIPGKNPFGYWFKNLFAEIITFPTVIILLILGKVLFNIYNSVGSNPWIPPFLYGIEPKNFAILLGMGMILMIPDLIKSLKELLGVKGLPLGLNLGTFFAGVGAGIGGATGMLGQFGSLHLGLSALGLTGRQGLFGVFGPKKHEPNVVPSPSGPGTPTGGQEQASGT